MEITLKNSYGYTEVVFEAENVKVVGDITQRLYDVDESGKSILKGKDISDLDLDKFVRFMEDLVYYRDREFDSTELICGLFQKMPQDKAEELLNKLNADYLG